MATTSTTKKNATGPTNAAMAAKRTVTYYVSTVVKGKSQGVDADKAVRNVAYAVAVDGTVLPEYNQAVKKFSMDGADPIRVSVEPGKKVSLYLNSDAVPGRRNNPVYEVTVNAKNVEVRVQEKLGKHADKDTPKLASSDKNTERYTAPLTGDIWMKISHKFTAAEVDALVPAGTKAEVTAAVKTIYAGLAAQTMTMTSGSLTTTLTFAGNENGQRHINSFSLTADGLPRVHPACFAAILMAAIDANVSNILMKSNWRPCLGSIAHRCGLGADVNEVDGTEMRHGPAGNARVDQLRNAYKAKPTAANKAAWEKARDANEPVKVQTFRRSLQQNPGVKQVIDPWQIDMNTRDDVAATTNLGGDANAIAHNNHLHITARDEFLIK